MFRSELENCWLYEHVRDRSVTRGNPHFRHEIAQQPAAEMRVAVDTAADQAPHRNASHHTVGAVGHGDAENLVAIAAEAERTMDDLRAFGVPVLILSGGEPLLRPDVFELSARAKAMGFYVGLSTNGTLIDDAMLERVPAIGYDLRRIDPRLQAADCQVQSDGWDRVL